VKKEKRRWRKRKGIRSMMRSPIPYLIAYIPLLIISLIFGYLGYLHKIKRYRRIFLRTLRKQGVPRRTARELCRHIKIISIKEFLKFGNMRSIL